MCHSTLSIWRTVVGHNIKPFKSGVYRNSFGFPTTSEGTALQGGQPELELLLGEARAWETSGHKGWAPVAKGAPPMFR